MGLFKIGRQVDDMPTFEAVLKQYERPVYWHIRRMVVSHEDAQDAGDFHPGVSGIGET